MRNHFSQPYIIVQEKRLELSWYCYHTDLNRTRLPIPPFLHNIIYYSGFGKKVNPFFEKVVWKSKLRARAGHSPVFFPIQRY